MADGRKLKINFLDPSNKSSSMTVSNVNDSSDTSTASLLNYSTGLINLTQNSYVSTTKIDEKKLD